MNVHFLSGERAGMVVAMPPDQLRRGYLHAVRNPVEPQWRIDHEPVVETIERFEIKQFSRSMSYSVLTYNPLRFVELEARDAAWAVPLGLMCRRVLKAFVRVFAVSDTTDVSRDVFRKITLRGEAELAFDPLPYGEAIVPDSLEYGIPVRCLCEDLGVPAFQWFMAMRKAHFLRSQNLCTVNC